MPGATNSHSIPRRCKACRSMLTPLAYVHAGDAAMRRRKRAIRLVAWLTRQVNCQVNVFSRHVNNLVSEWSGQLRIPGPFLAVAPLLPATI